MLVQLVVSIGHIDGADYGTVFFHAPKVDGFSRFNTHATFCERRPAW